MALVETKYDELTFEELARRFGQRDDDSRAILYDGYVNSVRCLIRPGAAGLCAYVGVPVDHPLAGFPYDDIALSVHGGLTFAGEFSDVPGWYFYGWDYSHAGDRCFYNVLRPIDGLGPQRDEHGWTVPEVANQMWDASYQLERLRDFAETLLNKAYKLVPVASGNDRAAEGGA